MESACEMIFDDSVMECSGEGMHSRGARGESAQKLSVRERE